MSERTEQLARLMNAERERVERLARRPIQRMTRAMRQAVLRAFREGGSIGEALGDHADELADLLTDAAVVSHLNARQRMLRLASSHSGTQLSAYDDAVRLLKARLLLSDTDIDGLRQTYRAEMVQAVADATGAVRRTLDRAVADVAERGLSVDAGMVVIRQRMEAAGIGVEPWQVETVFRTQTQLAYAAGRDNANQDPAIDQILWGFEYVAVEDDRARPEHLALDGMKAAKDDPIWQTHKPPLGFNCRCQIVPVFKDEAEARTKRPPAEARIDGVTVRPGPDPGWDFDPADLHRDTLSRATVAR